METRTDAYRVFKVTENGVKEDPVPQLMRGTLFGRLWDADKAALLRVDTPKGDDQFELEAARMKLASQLKSLPENLAVLGSGNGLRRGKVWAADKRIVAWCQSRFFGTSEEALSYGSLLFSENKAIHEADRAGLYEEDGPDGQGLVDDQWLRAHDLPRRQIQIRAAWPSTLAKGTLRPCAGLRAHTGRDFLFHETMLKGKSIDIDGPFLVGIRDVAEQRDFRSGWTVVEWLSESVRERLWERYAPEILGHLEDAFSSSDGALRLLAALPGKHCNTEARDLLHLLLHSGLEPSHPWLRNNLRKHVRQAYLDLALGLGLPLQGGMACWVGGLQDHKVAVPWLPIGTELVVGRYPIRDAHSLRVVKNSCAPVHEGSIGASEGLLQSLDGDVDGDYLFVVTDPDTIGAVRELEKTAPARLERGSKTRKKTHLRGIERVAIKAIGQTGIGTPTWLIAGALESDRADLVPELSNEIQNGVESFKWDVQVDWTVLERIQTQVELPEFLQLGQRKATFFEKAPRIGLDSSFGSPWNACAQHFQRYALDGTHRLGDYRDRIPSPRGELVAEASVMRDFYSSAIVNSRGDEDTIRSAVNLVRAWGAGKDTDRNEWAKTCWHLGHRSSHPKATGSFGLHPFPEELAELLGIEEEQLVDVLPPSFPGLDVHVEGDALFVNERKIAFEPLTYRRPVDPVKTTLLPIVGGWRSLMETLDIAESEALGSMRMICEPWRGKTVSVILKLEEVTWTSDPVVNAYVADQLVGSVAPEHADRVCDRTDEPVDALLSMRGRTVYAVVVA